MVDFKRPTVDYEILDLAYDGLYFTWNNNQYELDNIQEHLDRRLANPSWHQLYPTHKVELLELNTSNHRPLAIILETSWIPKPSSRQRH